MCAPSPSKRASSGSSSSCSSQGLPAAARQNSRARPLCGFTTTLPSPFHFGGTVPAPAVHSSRRSFPQQTDDLGGGLPSLERPGVRAARGRWLKAIDKLMAAGGADRALLGQVRTWVASGVRCAFPNGLPPQEKHANTFTFRKHESECLERMEVYQDMGSMRKIAGLPPEGAHVQPLHAVVKPGKATRVVFDLARNFNDFLPDNPFNMTTLQDAVDLSMEAGPAAWYVKLDISACFLSFPIHPDDQKYFYCEAGGDFYQFLSMVFGRKDAPRVATLLLDVVSAIITDAGVPHVRYLDDFFIVATTKWRAWACAHVASRILVEFGLALSLKKVEGPSQRLEFLGIIIDSLQEVLAISEERQAELLGLLQAFSKRKASSVVRLQSLLGKLAFATTVLPGARPFLRRIIDTISGRPCGQRKLGTEFKLEVRYWRAHIADWNGRAAWRAPASTPFVFASDASTSGFAYGLESCPQEAMVSMPPAMRPGTVRSGCWSASNGDAGRQQRSAEIQWGEFFCPVAAAVEYGPALSNSHVVFVVDNESDVHVVNRQRTREPRVAALLRGLCDTALRFNFSFQAVHRAGIDNVLMDWASRPDLHKFTARPSRLLSAPSALGEEGCGVGAYPPLRVATSLTHISSRCLSFDAKDSSVKWATTCGGWSPCAAPSTSRGRRRRPTRATTRSSWPSAPSSGWSRC